VLIAMLIIGDDPLVLLGYDIHLPCSTGTGCLYGHGRAQLVRFIKFKVAKV